MWCVEGCVGWILMGVGIGLIPFATLLDTVKVLTYPLRIGWNAWTGGASYDRY
jgi:hypothetical protein